MGVRLRRNLGPVSHLEPGEYTTETRDEQPAICCPGCGGISDLDIDTHEAFVDGVVAPIWACPFVSCPLIEFISLEAWREEVVA